MLRILRSLQQITKVNGKQFHLLVAGSIFICCSDVTMRAFLLLDILLLSILSEDITRACGTQAVISPNGFENEASHTHRVTLPLSINRNSILHLTNRRATTGWLYRGTEQTQNEVPV